MALPPNVDVNALVSSPGSYSLATAMPLSCLAAIRFALVFALVIAAATGEQPKDVVYSATAETVVGRGRLDVYRPADASAPVPLLIWFHGGGITSGSKDDQETTVVAERLAGQGIAVVAANYRLSPAARFPAYVEDGAQAVAWSIREAEQLNGDPARVYVGGYSAGAYLAAMLALDERYLRNAGVSRDRVAGFICLSGQMTTHFTVRKERGLDPIAVVVDDASPAYHAGRGAPPMLLLVGDQDLPARREENQLLAAVLTQVGGNRGVSLHVVADRTHATIVGRLLERGDPAGEAILAFLRKP
jgi:acetyl esterase/lipase